MITVWFKEQPFTTLIISDTINNEGYRTHNRKISDTCIDQKHCKIQHYPIQSILAVMFIHGVRRAMVQKFGFSISTLHNISQPHIRRQSFLSITHCAGRYYVAFFILVSNSKTSYCTQGFPHNINFIYKACKYILQRVAIE